MSPKGCVPLGIYIVEETKGLIDKSYGDCWVVRSYNADGHNGALMATICTQCHVTLMGSYMVRSKRPRVLIDADHTHGATHLTGCPNS